MKLKLLHGRTTPDEELDDWGFDGPTLEGVSYVHSAYTMFTVGFQTVELAEKAQELTGWRLFDSKVLQMQFEGEMVKTKQGFFGDFEVQEDSDG